MYLPTMTLSVAADNMDKVLLEKTTDNHEFVYHTYMEIFRGKR